jgi:hypothetical protein
VLGNKPSMSFSLPSSSLPLELAAPMVQLRAELGEINRSEQACMINAVVSASQGQRLPVVQAVMARCRQAAAAAAATAIATFRRECPAIGAQANSLANAVIVAAPTKSSRTSVTGRYVGTQGRPSRDRPRIGIDRYVFSSVLVVSRRRGGTDGGCSRRRRWTDVRAC